MTTTHDEDLELDFEGSMGGQSAEEEAAKRGGGGHSRRPGYFKLKEHDDSQLLRFLHDKEPTPEHPISWIHVGMHTWVPVSESAKPKDWEGNWPKGVSLACRNDKIFKKRYPEGCYVCDNIKIRNAKAKPSLKIFSLAVLREEVTDKQGTYVRDVMREVFKLDDKGELIEGEYIEVPSLVTVDMPWGNFYSKVYGMAGRWKTVMNRDLLVTRKGEPGDTKTDYPVSADDPFEVPDPTDPSGERMITYDLRNPILRQRYDDLGPEIFPDLRLVVARKAADDVYKYIIPGMAAEMAGGKKGGSSGGGRGPEAPSNDADPDKVAATRASIMARTQRPSGEPAAAGRRY